MPLTRRSFLTAGAFLASACLLPLEAVEALAATAKKKCASAATGGPKVVTAKGAATKAATKSSAKASGKAVASSGKSLGKSASRKGGKYLVAGKKGKGKYCRGPRRVYFPGGQVMPGQQLRLTNTERSLFLYHTATGEHFRQPYFIQGRYIPESLREINRLLRDHHNNAVHPIDKDLVDLMFALWQQLHPREPIHVICGYRSPSTNAAMRSHNSGVARHSLHIEGMAVDLRVPGYDTRIISQAAMSLQAGGVGNYPGNFVHVDVGDIRYW